jgi:UDPglucose 6-dehydrogenase
MKLVVAGAGYVGLVTGACLAEVGFDVWCVDTDAAKIARIEGGKLPIFEPQLDDFVERNTAKGRLHFTTSLGDAIRDADAVFLAVGTPESTDGSADLQYVEAVARTIGRELHQRIVVVTKSTVPVGTSHRLRAWISEELAARAVDVDFEIASNPEFLKEGSAIDDFMTPDRIVIGVDSERAAEVLAKVYRPFVQNGHALVTMDVASAEITKYAANAMLATRISFMNMIAGICESQGADVGAVKRGIGADSRIGSQFLNAGVGYGGPCFPKDVRALINTGEQLGVSMEILRAVDQVNERQKLIPLDRVFAAFGRDLRGRCIALWGLSFKPNTDDLRESPAVGIARGLTSTGARVVVYDPVSGENARSVLPPGVEIAGSAEGAVLDADALILVTEWPEFRSVNVANIRKAMRGDLVIDGRNVLDRDEFVQHGFRYVGVGTGRVDLP